MGRFLLNCIRTAAKHGAIHFQLERINGDRYFFLHIQLTFIVPNRPNMSYFSIGLLRSLLRSWLIVIEI